MVGGHGHVRPRPDGAKARCGGPRICSVCALELLGDPRIGVHVGPTKPRHRVKAPSRKVAAPSDTAR